MSIPRLSFLIVFQPVKGVIDPSVYFTTTFPLTGFFCPIRIT